MVRALGRQLWSLPSSQLMVIRQVVGSPSPGGGGQKLLSPPIQMLLRTRCLYHQLVGAKIQQKHPGCLEKSIPGTAVLPSRISVPESWGTFCGAICSPPKPASFPGCAENRAGGPAARRLSVAVWLSAPRRFAALPVPPRLSSRVGFISLLLIYLFSRGCLEPATVGISRGWFWC